MFLNVNLETSSLDLLSIPWNCGKIIFFLLVIGSVMDEELQRLFYRCSIIVDVGDQANLIYLKSPLITCPCPCNTQLLTSDLLGSPFPLVMFRPSPSYHHALLPTALCISLCLLFSSASSLSPPCHSSLPSGSAFLYLVLLSS
ncbi:hypothetical protein SAY87_009371 [Trapa incisa]|uniref:Uncharacterized protein n=1 Tax=Trapa incisa TaxID=236973 RepID=A0AAN7PXP1_9MYRT|nr:hypothetical protein SAY87_009371 [Trapa incisa]